MIIRNFRPSDFNLVDALWKETGIYTIERGDTREVISQCDIQGGEFLVLEDEETRQIAGTSWMTFDGRRIYLHHFTIKTSYRGKGWGRKLALRSLEVARRIGCPVKLEVHRENEPAIELYKSLGFSSFKDFDVYMLLNP
jgi:ribosomal protein S18 acetylase RimI-like enzyme